MLLRMEGVSRSFGSRNLFRDVSLTIHARDRIGLVGPNGAGKTTLLHIAAGLEPPDAGQVSRPRDVRVGMLRQEIDPGLQRSVREEVASVFAELDALEAQLSELEARMAEVSSEGGEIPAELADRYDDCRTRFELGGGFERGARVDRVLAGLGFDNERSVRALETFSGGWLMRVELAKLLLATPDVLLLDEPTNHLDLPSIQWFEETITEYPGAVVIISHDRTFLRRHVNRVAELEHGGLTTFDGSFDRYLQDKALRREERIAQKRTQDRKIAETERFITRFRAKATKAKQVQSRVKALEKLERIEVADDRTRRMRLRIPPVARSGESVLRLENIHKSYAETVVYTGIDFAIARGERVALVGPNGAGKSTLLRIAAGVLPFDAGERSVGHNVQIAFYAQHQLEVLDPSRTVLAELETVASVADTPRLRGHLGAFLFSGDDIEKKVSVLSGGEKARLALAKLLLHPTNFLVLDEPTNHLDLVSREVLEEALAGYTGTLLLISHDRAFINALVNRVVEVDHGRLASHPGNYDDYLRRQSRGAGPGQAPPGEAGEDEPARQAVEPVDPASVTASSEPEAAARPPTKKERIAAREEAKQQTRRHQRAARRLAEVEAEILGHEENLEQLSWRLGDPDLHRDPDRLRAIESERGELRETIDGLYREWERLAAEVEAGQQADA